MPTLLFYNDPLLLNREEHKSLHYQASSDFGFTKEVNSVPLTGIEFFEASRDFPVLFSCDDNGDYFPLVLLSLTANSHPLCSDSGDWGELYVPAFIRRYPFALTEDKNVCLDKSAPHFSETEGKALFSEDGSPSETLDAVITFLDQFDQQHAQTVQFCASAKEHDLFEPFNMQLMVAKDQPLRLDGLFTIKEEQLNKLPKTEVNKWFKNGWLAWSYAHLHSLGALRRMLNRHTKSVLETSEPNADIKH